MQFCSFITSLPNDFFNTTNLKSVIYTLPGLQDTEMSIVLAKDAFLVFRALCKLSIRSSESSTGSDPTAVRGKVCSRTTSICGTLSWAWAQ